ncbi:EF-hand domain-containing protein [Rhizorhabdus dicambivorans]|uniref:Histidine kinase n=1 Tax=Rhizorhabdus dicambivorans TaxID=1850238 RepID=A0A2A4FTU1_9SPHN|nr:EF-hand domain-containing protein [Rhizorhabdus dicambivorans]ATE64503.1 histidine kinase [Rhizorhabdus dicambivorans]PCE41597.1 histidine kinase [Rhizorhabdus dicambivorans]
MWRYLVGVLAGVLLVGGGVALWQSFDKGPQLAPAAPLQAAEPTPLAEPPAATEKTREEKRFGRYDKDKDGKVSREEFLASRRKAYARLDVNGDGRLSFEEWSVKTTDRFAKADGDKNATLTTEEFATTRIARKTARPAPCVPESEG